MSNTPPPNVLAAATKYGPSIDHIAHQYHISGADLLLKLSKGENSWGDKGVSSAGARGYTQFIPATRAAYIQKYGIDPWKDADSAFHATAIYLKHAGNIAAYNPGMSSYTKYILDQDIGSATVAAIKTPTTTTKPGFGLPKVAKQDSSAVDDALVTALLSGKRGTGLLNAINYGLDQIPQTTTAPPTKTVAHTASAPGGGQDTSYRGDYPLGKHGKIIGTPYAGTHTLGNWQSDNAVDIAVPIGTRMLAWRPGTVIKVDRHPQDGGRFAGDAITIRYDNGQEAFYKHGVSHVHVGEKVGAGSLLGTTGSANGVAHLHIGILKGNPLHKWGS